MKKILQFGILILIFLFTSTIVSAQLNTNNADLNTGSGDITTDQITSNQITANAKLTVTSGGVEIGGTQSMYFSGGAPIDFSTNGSRINFFGTDGYIGLNGGYLTHVSSFKGLKPNFELGLSLSGGNLDMGNKAILDAATITAHGKLTVTSGGVEVGGTQTLYFSGGGGLDFSVNGSRINFFGTDGYIGMNGGYLHNVGNFKGSKPNFELGLSLSGGNLDMGNKAISNATTIHAQNKITGDDGIYITAGTSTFRGALDIDGNYSGVLQLFNGANLLCNSNDILNADEITCNTLTESSDARYKKQVSTLTEPLDLLKQIRGVRFIWDQVAFPEKNFSNTPQIGFIAQEIETVFPEFVHNDKDGYKSVEYSKMTAVLVEAVKEQQKIIELQQQTINEMKEKLDKVNALSEANAQILRHPDKLEINKVTEKQSIAVIGEK